MHPPPPPSSSSASSTTTTHGEENDRLLMEALMYFSSDSSEASNEVERDQSESETGDGDDQDAFRSPRGPSSVYLRTVATIEDEDELDSAVAAVLEHFPGQRLATDERTMLHVSVHHHHSPSGDMPRLSPSLKSSPLHRKKPTKSTKKCTYAARREEVTRLRNEVAKLEQELGKLTQRRRMDNPSWTRAETERRLLADARVENTRLNAAVAAQEAHIRRAEASLQRR